MSSLTEAKKKEIEVMLRKLREKRLEQQEAQKLRTYLEEEKEQALTVGDFVLAMAAGLLLVGIAEYLSGYFFKKK
jgi:D-Tyr-tRNAtyr deacylase